MYIFVSLGVCVNWFGKVDWTAIPFKPTIKNGPWGLTPNGCTKDAVSQYGAYSCNVLEGSEYISCDGDCLNGVCVSGKNYGIEHSIWPKDAHLLRTKTKESVYD